MDGYVEALFQALPASTYAEIRQGMQKELGARVSMSVVNNTLHHVRKHSAACGFTISYVKRGVATDGDEDRYFALPLEKSGSGFRLDDTHRHHCNSGNLSTFGDISTKSKNLAEMIAVRSQYERSPQVREDLDDLRENLEFLARRATRMKDKAAKAA